MKTLAKLLLALAAVVTVSGCIVDDGYGHGGRGYDRGHDGGYGRYP